MVFAAGMAGAVAACGGTSATSLTGPEPTRCAVALDGLSTLPAHASQTVVQVATDRECEWSAGTNVPWLQPTPRAGTGSASVTLTAAANPSSAARTGVLTVGSQPLTVTQLGAVFPPVGSNAFSARSTLSDR